MVFYEIIFLKHEFVIFEWPIILSFTWRHFWLDTPLPPCHDMSCFSYPPPPFEGMTSYVNGPLCITCIISKVHIDMTKWPCDSTLPSRLRCTLVKVVVSGANGERAFDARSSFWTGAKSFLIQSSSRKVLLQFAFEIFSQHFQWVRIYVWFRRLTWVRIFIWTLSLCDQVS